MLLCGGAPLEHDSATLFCRSWTLEQIKRSDELRIAVLYASAYGNTAGMAQVGDSMHVPAAGSAWYSACQPGCPNQANTLHIVVLSYLMCV